MNDETIECEKNICRKKSIINLLKEARILRYYTISSNYVKCVTRNKFAPWYCLFLHRKYDLVSNSSTTFDASCLIEENNLKLTDLI